MEPKLSFWTRFLLRVAGADRRLVIKTPEDIPVLRGLGFQLVGVFFVYFTLQSIALSTITGRPEFAVPFALLCSSLLLALDRALIAGDARVEGEYLWKKSEGHNDAVLRSLMAIRLGRLFLRLALGISISFIVVFLATPGMFGPEIRDAIESRCETARAPIYREVEAYEARLKEQLAREIAQQESDCRVADELNTILTERAEPSGQASTPTIEAQLADIADRIRGLEAQERNALDDAERFATYANAEEQGLRITVVINGETLETSGLAGCHVKCEFHKGEAGRLTAVAARARTAIENLNRQRQALRDESEAVAVRQRERFDQETAALRARRDREATTCLAARERVAELENAINDEVRTFRFKRLNEDEDAPTCQKTGLLITLNEYSRLIGTAERRASDLLDLLKYFVILIEIGVFISKIANSPSMYSRLYYQHYRLGEEHLDEFFRERLERKSR